MVDDAGLLRFVRGLLSGATARRVADAFVQPDGRRAAVVDVEALRASGVVDIARLECRSNAATPSWLKRRLLGDEGFASQHREVVTAAGGEARNVNESPLTRLAHAARGEVPFLDRHHLEAGERVRRLVERAQLGPRLTMAYSPSQTAGTRGAAGDISDLAADARRALAEIHRVLPRDCAGVVLDVCGLLKGLQEVERERGWPRRSAKLVLRIGLDQLADHYGLSAVARGNAKGRPRGWMEDGARPQRFE